MEVAILTCVNLCSISLKLSYWTVCRLEKHVPVVEKIEGGYRVTVGEVEHPMTEAHSILWIELVTNNNEVLRKYLEPTVTR